MKDKVKDMVRSILPSTARKSARDGKKIASRKARHSVKQQLHEELSAEESDLSGALHEIDRENRKDVRNLVSNRRNSDKVGSFVRWAEAKTKDIPEENLKERRDLIAGEIDAFSSVITKHALDHFIPDYHLNPHRHSRFYYQGQSEILLTAKQMRDALQKAYETNHHTLNKVLKYIRIYPCGKHSHWEDPVLRHRFSLPLPVKGSYAPCYKTEKLPIYSYTYRQIVKKNESGAVIDTYLIKDTLKKPDASKVFGEVTSTIYGYKSVLIHDEKLCAGIYLIKDQQSLNEVLDYFGKDVYSRLEIELGVLITYLIELGCLEAKTPELQNIVALRKKQLNQAKA